MLSPSFYILYIRRRRDESTPPTAHQQLRIPIYIYIFSLSLSFLQEPIKTISRLKTGASLFCLPTRCWLWKHTEPFPSFLSIFFVFSSSSLKQQSIITEGDSLSFFLLNVNWKSIWLAPAGSPIRLFFFLFFFPPTSSSSSSVYDIIDFSSSFSLLRNSWMGWNEFRVAQAQV